MIQSIHGGDIYQNKVKWDFSVNVNPLGVPKEIENALYKAVGRCQEYPDIQALALKEAVSKQLAVPKQYLLFGNGASEIFMGLVHAMKPKKILIPVPSFWGYEYVAKAEGSEIQYFLLKKENFFLPGEELFHILSEDIDLLFLANPNNPTGQLLEHQYLQNLLNLCRKQGIYVVLDECFIGFCKEEKSFISKIEEYPNLILIQAFTKIYSIPGVRLGFMISSNEELVEKIARHLPEWNLSVFAQEAGIACVKQKSYIEKTVEYVEKERIFLAERLQMMGIQVCSGVGNFILIYTEIPLYKLLLERGILIRDCQNFRGLSKGYYRIAVKCREHNEILLREIGECFAENRTVIAGRN